MRTEKTPKELRELFISTAESYVGYTASADRLNIFGERLGSDGQPWDGAFIDVIARETGLSLPSHTYVTVALAEYIGSGIFHVRPRRGDIVFFVTSTVMDFGSPHIGIVTDASRHAIDGTFETVEGMTSSGQPRGTNNTNGVYKRIRHQSEVIGYARPRFITVAPKEIPSTVPYVVTAQVKPGIRHKNVEVVQLALAVVTGVRGLPRGHFDKRTQLAFAKFQRMIGVAPSLATGAPDLKSLDALAEKTGLFKTRES
jgi:hypothetical protein